MHEADAKALLNSTNGMNIYRGCVHGCIYCDSRSACYQFTHPFEDVEVKRNAPELLEAALHKKRKRCVIATGSMSDPYQPCEKELRLMRRCLERIERCGFGASVITKSDLVLRDLDLFESIHQRAKSVLQMTLTVADDALSRVLEPNVCPSSRRYEVLKEFQSRGIPGVVWLSPLSDRHGGEPPPTAGLLFLRRGEGDCLLRHRPDPAAGKPGILLQPA